MELKLATLYRKIKEYQIEPQKLGPTQLELKWATLHRKIRFYDPRINPLHPVRLINSPDFAKDVLI